ncbi:MAG: hypothetical protein KBA96_13450 [Rhodocyclaceae bacterium]|nr:hypothetical protein [Rhodocyclaceae bacterium]MBK9625857.1 hypothetical protein [Rhodocyclaceae bacterium]MBL0074584.1 hypothetical protein [Rhodocyclaceae bacterium]MBP7082113.1 hypothetical protein [Rhodocyclaceae bacterium]
MSKNRTGTVLALAAATMFASGVLVAPIAAAADAPSVKCVGANSCKGTSECKTAKSECKGHNSCKGQGWTKAATEKACTDAGGKVTKA